MQTYTLVQNKYYSKYVIIFWILGEPQESTTNPLRGQGGQENRGDFIEVVIFEVSSKG